MPVVGRVFLFTGGFTDRTIPVQHEFPQGVGAPATPQSRSRTIASTPPDSAGGVNTSVELAGGGCRALRGAPANDQPPRRINRVSRSAAWVSSSSASRRQIDCRSSAASECGVFCPVRPSSNRPALRVVSTSVSSGFRQARSGGKVRAMKLQSQPSINTNSPSRCFAVPHGGALLWITAPATKAIVYGAER